MFFDMAFFHSQVATYSIKYTNKQQQRKKQTKTLHTHVGSPLS